MFFNSFEFIFFLSIVLFIYYALSFRYQNIFLLIVSYIFYGWWDYRFLALLAFSTGVDFWIARQIQIAKNEKFRKSLLLISICISLGVLGFFKYFNFFADSLLTLLTYWRMESTWPTVNIILPVGISFYTFQTMSYTIDVYRRKQEATSNFFLFALYVSYFPQLVAGPIERAQTLLPALSCKRQVSQEQLVAGLQLMLIGFVKKVAIADAVAPYVNQIFDSPSQFTALELLLGCYLFAMQIYGDFSGYSDIARGVSKLLGIELMINFRQPYLAHNIQDFWHRWHISLSTWLRDYLYIPLGGNRKGKITTYQNLLITMILGGLWHGAAWTFVIWGFLHGIYLLLYRLFNNNSKHNFKELSSKDLTFGKLASVFATVHVVCLTWIFFRAPNLAVALEYLNTMFSFDQLWFMASGTLLSVTLFYGVIVVVLDLPLYRNDRELLVTQQTFWVYRGVAYALLILLLSFIGESHAQPFIYFQF